MSSVDKTASFLTTSSTFTLFLKEKMGLVLWHIQKLKARLLLEANKINSELEFWRKKKKRIKSFVSKSSGILLLGHIIQP